ncbi:MAG: hypothetical protein M1825_003130 [Sarcosagium campestre]|nr:MAG: hypothetical protein M1825_003130 [Sarcosagium campestre]
MRASSKSEFPSLAGAGLYAAETGGNGNCLFNALSDQIYGNQDHHRDIRAQVIEYMREHASYYKQFVDVNAGQRRNPKRKNAGAFSSPVQVPTAEQIEGVFEAHLTRMARGGEYGDNLEITAFSEAYRVDVSIQQRDNILYVSTARPGEVRRVAYIAYHTWEHYSSIRNVAGPHTGMPNVKPATAQAGGASATASAKLNQTPVAAPWMIEVVMQSVPHIADRLTVKRALEASRGNIDEAVDKLLDLDQTSASSTQPSSVERELDSDDEASVGGPAKKQDRRLSRATQKLLKAQARPVSLSSSMDQDDIEEQPVPAPVSPSASASASSSEGAVVKKPSLMDDARALPSPKPSYDTDGTRDDDVESEISTTSRASVQATARKPASQKRSAGSAQGRRITARERKDTRKAAQKAAAKARKQGKAVSGTGGKAYEAAAAAVAAPLRAGSDNKERQPAMMQHIKTLYI